MTKEAEEKKEQQQPQQPVDVPGLLPSSHWASVGLCAALTVQSWMGWESNVY